MTRTTWATLLLVPAMALAACGGDTADEPTETKTPTADEETSTETTPAPAEDDETTEDAAAIYDPSMDATTLTHEDGPGTRVEVFFILDADDQAIYEAARACVDHYLDQGNSAVYCYGFASQEAVDAANIDPDGGGMGHLCWRARDGQAHAGNRSGHDSNMAYTDPCP